VKKANPFKTHLEIVGGKIIIPSGDSVGIELVNNPDSRILVSLEYDPELYPEAWLKSWSWVQSVQKNMKIKRGQKD